MELGILLIVLFLACVGGTIYFGIKFLLALLDSLAPEPPPDDGDRDITIHIEITGLPNPAEADQEQPQPPSSRP